MKITVVGFSISVIIVSIAIVATLSSNYSETSQDKLRVAFFPSIGHAVPIVGLENGFFQEKIGDQTKIETKIFDSGPQVIESIFAGSIDIAYVGPGPIINGFLKSDGMDVKILSGAASGGASFIVQSNSGLDSIENFDGKRIASPQISNSQDVSLRYYLASNGLAPVEKGGTVFVLNISNPDIYTLFAKGDIDGAWVSEPWATLLVEELDGIRLFNEEKLWPGEQFASVLLISRTNYLENNPILIQNWIKSHEQTVLWINSNPDKAKIIFSNFLKKYMGKSLPSKIIDKSFSNLEITSDPIKNSVLTFAERADSLGYLGRNGYNLDGIFYQPDLNSNIMVEQQNG
jgi:NitT/TauT family transport system substrate-binding protein